MNGFYRKVELLKGLPIKTIDASQGQEYDIVFISVSRTKGSGFLISPQRVNVAMTRAKKCLILLCNFKAVKVSKLCVKKSAKDVTLLQCLAIVFAECKGLGFTIGQCQETKSFTSHSWWTTKLWKPIGKIAETKIVGW